MSTGSDKSTILGSSDKSVGNSVTQDVDDINFVIKPDTITGIKNVHLSNARKIRATQKNDTNKSTFHDHDKSSIAKSTKEDFENTQKNKKEEEQRKKNEKKEREKEYILKKDSIENINISNIYLKNLIENYKIVTPTKEKNKNNYSRKIIDKLFYNNKLNYCYLNDNIEEIKKIIKKSYIDTDLTNIQQKMEEFKKDNSIFLTFKYNPDFIKNYESEFNEINVELFNDKDEFICKDKNNVNLFICNIINKDRNNKKKNTERTQEFIKKKILEKIKKIINDTQIKDKIKEFLNIIYKYKPSTDVLTKFKENQDTEITEIKKKITEYIKKITEYIRKEEERNDIKEHNKRLKKEEKNFNKSINEILSQRNPVYSPSRTEIISTRRYRYAGKKMNKRKTIKLKKR